MRAAASWRWARAAGGAALPAATTILLLAACGQSSTASHTSSARAKPARVSVCLPKARDALARAFAVPTGAVALAASTGNNDYPQCTFSAHLPNGRRADVIANADNGPQPYFVLERTEVEETQQFTAQRMIAAPTPVSRLGLDAWWFPAETKLMTTDGVQLITITVSWPHATQARERALAKVIARTYLKDVKGAQVLAKGYP